MVAGATGIGTILDDLTPVPNLSLIYLLAVLLTAVRFGIWPAIYASLLSFAAYNFFFIAPLYTFTIAEPYELLALAIFLIVAIITSAVAGRARYQASVSASRMRAMRRLYEFTRRLSGLATPDAVAEGAASEMHISLARSVEVLLNNDADLELVAAWPPEDSLDATAMTAARWAYQHNEPAGANTGTLPIIPWYFIPLRFGERMLGVVGIAREKEQRNLDSESLALLDTLAEQAASALDRAMLSREMVSAKTATEAERVRNTMLASISHDFRTPLSSILGSASSLIDYGEKLDPVARNDLLQHIKSEAEGLDELVRNLLAVTRIEAGALELRRDWVDLREIVQRVVSAARRRGAAQHFETRLPPDLPMIRADAALIEQAIGSVVANAVAHTPRQTTIGIEGAEKENEVELVIVDDGPGIPPDALPRIFEKFVSLGSVSSADGGHGTGLGLAITKGIAEAHGGSIEAQSPLASGHGTRFILRLPHERSEP